MFSLSLFSNFNFFLSLDVFISVFFFLKSCLYLHICNTSLLSSSNKNAQVLSLLHCLFSSLGQLLTISLSIPTFKDLGGKKKNIVGNEGNASRKHFSFSHNICHPIKERLHHLNHNEIVVCK